jgi:NAD(P)-dependent dehydrogenase (short-subunit alcohol dehydrogenase family)
VGGPQHDPDRTLRDVVEVNLTGTWNTINVTAPGLIERGRGDSIVLTSSTQGLVGRGGDGSGGPTGYAASKHGIAGLMRSAANGLALTASGSTCVHPTGVNTPIIMNPLVTLPVDAGLTVR